MAVVVVGCVVCVEVGVVLVVDAVVVVASNQVVVVAAGVLKLTPIPSKLIQMIALSPYKSIEKYD